VSPTYPLGEFITVSVLPPPVRLSMLRLPSFHASGQQANRFCA
jgi:hypothetical protein